MKDAWQEPGLGSMVSTLDVYDEGAQYKGSRPVPSYPADNVTTSLKEFLGSDV